MTFFRNLLPLVYLTYLISTIVDHQNFYVYDAQVYLTYLISTIVDSCMPQVFRSGLFYLFNFYYCRSLKSQSVMY